MNELQLDTATEKRTQKKLKLRLSDNGADFLNSQAPVSCFAVECQRRTGTEEADTLEPQRNERERNKNMETEKQPESVCSQSRSIAVEGGAMPSGSGGAC